MSRFFLPIILLFLTRILNSEPVFGQYQHNFGFYMPKYPIHQYPVQHPQQHSFFRSGLNTNYPSAPPSLYSSNNDEVQNHQMSRQPGDPRFGLFDFFTTYTFTVSFTTRTTTITATTICTTSAAFVKTWYDIFTILVSYKFCTVRGIYCLVLLVADDGTFISRIITKIFVVSFTMKMSMMVFFFHLQGNDSH